MVCEFKKSDIQGIYEIQPKVFGDNRGYSMETYNEREFIQAGLNVKFVQDNQSFSTKNVLRGLHFQKKHPQGKLIRVVYGEVYDVAVDLRCGSKTFGKYSAVILSGEKQNMFYIPEGFAHGFCVLSETATFAYKCTDFYAPEDEAGLMWNDPLIGIDWEAVCPGITKNAILSQKDMNHPAFMLENKYFDLNAKIIGK